MRSALAGLLAAGIAGVASAPAQTPYVMIAPPEAGIGVCPGGICQPEALEGVFTALRAMESGERHAAVHILQLGDSHTAADRITGAVRVALQRRFGVGGRGVLPAGSPYGGYAPMQIQVEAEGWSVTTAPLSGPSAYRSVDVGLAGTAPPTYGRTPMLRFTPEPGTAPTVLSVCGRGGPGAAGFHIEMSGRRIPVSFNQTRPGPVCQGRRLSVPPGETLTGPIELRAHGDGALAYSLRLEGPEPGVTLSNLGVIGATLQDLASRDEDVVRVELADWRPSLIILGYGTNEGFDDGLDATAYEALLRSEIERMRRLSPAASLMILGAPDAQRNGTTNGCGADGTRAPPPSLAVVRDVQRRVAADMGVAFWDWHGRMGGDCSADRLALRAEPLVRGDRVHFTSAGADWIGGVMAADLTAAYDAWEARQGRVD